MSQRGNSRLRSSNARTDPSFRRTGSISSISDPEDETAGMEARAELDNLEIQMNDSRREAPDSGHPRRQRVTRPQGSNATPREPTRSAGSESEELRPQNSTRIFPSTSSSHRSATPSPPEGRPISISSSSPTGATPDIGAKETANGVDLEEVTSGRLGKLVSGAVQYPALEPGEPSSDDFNLYQAPQSTSDSPLEEEEEHAQSLDQPEVIAPGDRIPQTPRATISNPDSPDSVAHDTETSGYSLRPGGRKLSSTLPSINSQAIANESPNFVTLLQSAKMLEEKNRKLEKKYKESRKAAGNLRKILQEKNTDPTGVDRSLAARITHAEVGNRFSDLFARIRTWSDRHASREVVENMEMELIEVGVLAQGCKLPDSLSTGLKNGMVLKAVLSRCICLQMLEDPWFLLRSSMVADQEDHLTDQEIASGFELVHRRISRKSPDIAEIWRAETCDAVFGEHSDRELDWEGVYQRSAIDLLARCSFVTKYIDTGSRKELLKIVQSFGDWSRFLWSQRVSIHVRCSSDLEEQGLKFSHTDQRMKATPEMSYNTTDVLLEGGKIILVTQPSVEFQDLDPNRIADKEGVWFPATVWANRGFQTCNCGMTHREGCLHLKHANPGIIE